MNVPAPLHGIGGVGSRAVTARTPDGTQQPAEAAARPSAVTARG